MLLGGLLTHDGCGMLLAGGQKHLACARTCPTKSSCRSSGGAWGWQRGVCWASSNDPASFSELWIFRTIIVFGWSMINEWMSGMSWTFRLINFHGSQIHASPILDQFSHSQIVLDLSLYLFSRRIHGQTLSFRICYDWHVDAFVSSEVCLCERRCINTMLLCAWLAPVCWMMRSVFLAFTAVSGWNSNRREDQLL